MPYFLVHRGLNAVFRVPRYMYIYLCYMSAVRFALSWALLKQGVFKVSFYFKGGFQLASSLGYEWTIQYLIGKGDIRDIRTVLYFSEP